MSNFANLIKNSATKLRTGLSQPIDTAVILGSGLSGIAQHMKVHSEVNYRDIGNMPEPTVPSHKGKVQFGELAGKSVALCHGRLHLYESYSAQQVVMLVYIMNLLGARQLIITNAAGALNSAYRPGDIMIINDQINCTGASPLIGQDDTLGQRFVDMSQAYNPLTAANALRSASDSNLSIHSGIYAGVLGPSLETSAERRMLRQLGADAVGMSTVLEVIAANHCGMNVLGLSAITNLALGDSNQGVDTIEAVLENAAKADDGITELISKMIGEE